MQVDNNSYLSALMFGTKICKAAELTDLLSSNMLTIVW